MSSIPTLGLATSSDVVCLGYCLINERVEIALRSYEYLTIMLFSGRRERKKLCYGFPTSKRPGSHRGRMFLICMSEKRDERKEQSGISSLFNRTSSGFCGEKSLQSVYNANEQTVHVHPPFFPENPQIHHYLLMFYDGQSFSC